jgi:hypothetical protein
MNQMAMMDAYCAAVTAYANLTTYTRVREFVGGQQVGPQAVGIRTCTG